MEVAMNEQTERGFALPAAVLGLVVIGVLVTGGFYIARQEHRIGLASENGTHSFYLAEQGVADVMVNWSWQTYSADTAWSSMTVSDTTDAGVWTVEVTEMSDRLFFLDGQGDAPLAAVLAGGSIGEERMASRRVGMIARVLSAAIEPPAALTTRGDVQILGTAEVHGEDVDPPGWADVCAEFDAEDKIGILVDDSSNVMYAGKGRVTGVPEPVVHDPDLDDATFTEFGEWSWDELISLATLTFEGGNFNGMEPSFTEDGSCDRADRMNWGDPLNPASACGTYFPIVYISGSMTVQSASMGQGVLLVEKDIDVRGDFLWHGIIIAQGAFETQGSGNRVLGGVLASNVVLDDERTVGGSVVQQSNCAAMRAILFNDALSRARPLGQRGWVDLSSVMP
jgi:hypothetical protein